MEINNKFDLSPKQRQFLFDEGKRLNFLTGSVRSGKTYISLLKWALWVASMPPNYEFIMVGKTVTSLKRNCLNLLEDFVGINNFQYSPSQKIARLFGRIVYLEGANDERSEQKIRGMTLGGAYCDEVTLYPESFFSMLLSRLSVEGAKLWATCNPDVPNHYIKEKYIDKAKDLNCNVWNFLLTDNTFLPKEYIENVSKEYSGVFYNRFILGQWVRAEGVIYNLFANDTERFILPDDFDFKQIKQITFGVDFGGNKSATTFVCTGYTPIFKDVIVLEAERHEQELTPEKLDLLYSNFIQYCTEKYKKFGYTYADSEAQILIRGLKNATMKNGLKTEILNSRKMAIFSRIQLVIKLMGQDRFKVARHCTSVIKALQEAVWDEKKNNERLDDLTSDIDTLDAMEYSIEPHYKDIMDYTLMKNGGNKWIY
ncbi:MAG: PBSX family phage terminase large subunit [Clostridia bacterium]|nr:PBSX family phage terminase large subunit [Clostridia bacterium]